MKPPRKRQLVGRKILDFRRCQFADGRGGIAYDPEIILDNGTAIRFVVQETDVGEYGVLLVLASNQGEKQ